MTKLLCRLSLMTKILSILHQKNFLKKCFKNKYCTPPTTTRREKANKLYELYQFIDHNVVKSADCKKNPEKKLKTAYCIGQTIRESETKQMQLNGNTLTLRNFSASDN